MPHTHDKLCFCSEVFVIFKDKVLLRMHDKYNFWLSIGGHVESGEDPVQAAIREVKEEVGLDVELFDGYVVRAGSEHCLVPPRFLSRHRVSPTHEHVVNVFFAKTKTDKVDIPETEKAQCKWFSMEELDDPQYDLKPDIKHYAKTALSEVSK